MTGNREEKLSAAVRLAQDLKGLRTQLQSYAHDHSLITGVLNDAILRIESQLHRRWWPPIWWRYGRIDAEASWLAHSFNRMDSEGLFFAQTPSGYLPEREDVLAAVALIYQSYKAARH